MNKKQLAVIIDLDGTLCNNDHRQHFLEGEKKDWGSFFGEELKDGVNSWCRFIVNCLPREVKIIYLTGRKLPASGPSNTKEWLIQHGFSRPPQTALIGRAVDDFRKDWIIKEEIYKQRIEPEYDVMFAIDDRQQVVDMWRRIGVTCLQCADNQF